MEETMNKAGASAKSSLYNPKVAWLALLGGLLIYFVNSAAQYKVPPIMIELNDALGLSLADSGWLMSIMSLMGLIMALPAGGIIEKIGVKWATVIAAAFQLIGSLIGTFATGFGLMLFSRALEGVALGLCNVSAFAVIAAFFPPEKRGLPNSLNSASFTVSVFLMMNVAVPLNADFGWQGVWWFVTALSVLALLAALFFIPGKAHEIDFEDNKEMGQTHEKISVKKLLTTPAIWIVPCVFIVFNIGYFGISTYAPTYLVETVGADLGTADLAVSWMSLVGLPAAIVAGIALDKIKVQNRKWIAAVAMFLLAVGYFFAFSMPSVESEAALLIAVGFVNVFVPVALYTIGPDIIPSAAYTAIILAIVTFGQNIGMTLGPIVVGYIVEAAGAFEACAVPLGVLAAIGGAIMLFVKVRGSKDSQNQESDPGLVTGNAE